VSACTFTARLRRWLDPGLTGRDFADAGKRLDQMPDEAFTPVGLGGRDIARLRERFASWPRLAPQRRADPDAEQRSLPDPDAVVWDVEPPYTDMEAGQ
jgi:hypothetical protein